MSIAIAGVRWIVEGITYTFNKDLKWPDDFYPLLLWLLFWFSAHEVVTRKIFRPIAEKYVSEPTEVPPEKSTKLDAPSETDATLRKRTSSKKAEESAVPEKSENKVFVEEPKEDKARMNKNLRRKFVRSAWFCLNYIITAVIAWTIIMSESEPIIPTTFFKGWPEKQTMSPNLKLLYQIAFGSYSNHLAVLFIYPKQKDFLEMFIHHITTLLLIYFSYTWGFYRIGAVVYALHELADPFLEFAKCSLYLKRQTVADVFFGLFALVFFVSRNFIFPVYVISSIPLYAYHEDGSLIPFGRADVHYGFFALLCILEILHIFWFSLIVKVALTTVLSKGGVEGDIRDEDE
ncbi:Ceramide synthase 3 [Nowakowskiella sp. JEL0407]|nr:Ceramide synthase 3 [Nowakowskiella sp. JEL0407]